LLDLASLEQTYTREVHLEKRVEGELVGEERYTLKGRMYLKNELELILQIAEFRQITVRGDYRDEPATAAHKQRLFTAIKATLVLGMTHSKEPT